MEIYINCITSNQRLLLLGDHSACLRQDTVVLQERTDEYQPGKIKVNQPIGVGFGYSTLAYISEAKGSWALPLIHERINGCDTAMSKLSEQLTQAFSCL
ncbi:MAG: hypothetical protein MK289_15205 [Trichodesmium sp. ALOHA_ZT_67]|nr:hypothetical protein [Trichodesmium sp. ALOHA_ZT_67]MDE5095262.1 hypothetical protein [Trichodesmium sp. St11_bin5]